MIYFLTPILFLSVGWFLHDPVNLFATSILFCFMLISLMNRQTYDFKSKKFITILISLPFIYLISGILNGQSFESILLGAYQRNYGLTTIISLSLILFLGSRVDSHPEKFVNFGLLPTLVLANIYGYIQYFDLDPIPWLNPFNAVSLTLGNPNFAGALFGMLVIVPVVNFVYTKKKLFKIFNLILAFSSIFLGIQTKSLQSQLLVIVSILVVIFLYCRESKKLKYKIIQYFTIFVSAILTAFIILVFSTSLLAPIRSKLFYQGNVQQRLDYWRTGIKIWQDHPFFGVGPDEFHRYAAFYRDKVQINRDGNWLIPDKAHNVFIDHLANGGIFAGLSWLSLVLFVNLSILKLSKKLEKNKPEFLIITSVWVAYVVQSLISPDQLVLMVIGYSAAGLIIGIYSRSVNTSIVKTKINKSGTFIFILITTLFCSLLLFGRALDANSKMRFIIEGNRVSEEKFLQIIKAWPNAKFIELTGIELIKDSSKCDLTNQIADELLRIDNRSQQAWFFKAVCANANRDFDSAIKFIENSIKFDPLNSFYLISKAKLEIAANQLDQAAQTVAKVKAIKPSEPEIGALESSIAVLQKETD